jgi:hypothetical protein
MAEVAAPRTGGVTARSIDVHMSDLAKLPTAWFRGGAPPRSHPVDYADEETGGRKTSKLSSLD